MERVTAPGSRELARSWQGILGRLELELNPHNFATWLRGTRAVEFAAQRLVVEAASEMACSWLDQRLRVVVERAAEQVLGAGVSVKFVAPGPGTGAAGDCPAEQPPPEPKRGPIIGGLNCANTFEEYLPSEGNLLALESCRALLDEGSYRATPVVIFGNPGMGKTHLLHAVACAAAERGRAVVCMGAGDFTTRFITSIKDRRAEDFQSAVRGANLLVIDDLQQLVGRSGTQEELADTIEAIHNAGGHVVIASERHPLELNLLDRLQSRLVAGIVTRVEPFRNAERRAFIERVTRRARTALPAWTAERIAGCEVASVRVLLGAVHAAIALERSGRLDLGRLDLELSRVALADAANGEIGERELLERIARHYGVSLDDMAGRSRLAKVAAARAVAVAMLQERGRSLNQAGTILGGRDKSTMSGLAARGRELIAAEPGLRALAG